MLKPFISFLFQCLAAALLILITMDYRQNLMALMFRFMEECLVASQNE